MQSSVCSTTDIDDDHDKLIMLAMLEPDHEGWVAARVAVGEYRQPTPRLRQS